MKRIYGCLLRFSVILFIMAVDVSVLVSYKSFSASSSPPTNGDWVVTGTESYYDEVFVLNGNLIVESSGNLTFRKVTLRVNCIYNGQYNITIMPGGKFYVLEGSVITSESSGKRIGWVFVHENSTFRMNNSELHECGYMDPYSCSGLYVRSDDAIIENSLFSRHTWGINILSNGVILRNNNITANDYRGIAIHFCSPSINNNTITSNLGGGIEIFWNNSNPLIEDNTIALNNVGIRGQDYCRPIIEGNNITSNNEAGIALAEYCAGTIQGNIIMNNSNGVRFSNHSNPIVQGNIITSNRANGISCVNNSQPEVHWNDIHDNTNFDVINEDISSTINATSNYWGDGPSTSSNVLYDPWLTESIFYAEITDPISRETVSSTVTISTKVNARNGLEKVEFYIDNKLENVDYDASYEWNWDTTQYTQTEHKITAKAHDMLGLKISTFITVLVDNTPPTVSIEAPTPQNIYNGTINVNVNATDNQEIVSVHFKVDNTEWLVMIYDTTDFLWKHDLNTTALSDGQHTLMVLALDKANNPATTSTTMLIDNTPPALTIRTPQGGMTVGLTLIVNVQANDVSGISKIEFYLQDVLVYAVTSTPYQWSWDTTKYSNGEYTIIVKAYDMLGRVQTGEVTVTVKNVESQWWQTHFWAIVQVLVGIGGLILGIVTYLTGKKKKRKIRERTLT